ncbi:MAG: FKBP-type peptidyl-prolyl cis-trans isomerase [Phycisphaerales bacterium]|jgi:FKBP-type peptidyl-prolyl cis-trans isomerase|nr:FKBP-type peptidyl-prolyl cis-trans isomerase [Phycisphaerales bacterium]
MTRIILSTTLFAAALTACDGGSQEAATPTPPKVVKAEVPATPKVDAAELPGAAVSGDGNELGTDILSWTITQGTGDVLPVEPTMATMKISGWAMNGRRFFGGVDGGDELVLPTGDEAAFSGWATAIGDMKVGETRKVWIGAEGRDRWPLGGQTPQDLVMDIELVSFGDGPALPSPLPGTPVADSPRNGSSSGLRWYDLNAGTGPPLAAGDTATIRCAGWLEDGTPWQATGGMPVRFTLDETAWPALAEGLAGMSPGGSRKLIVPPTLGTGFNPLGDLPPGSTIILDVEYVGPTEATASADGN